MTTEREAAHTVAFVEDDWAHDRAQFANVRHFAQCPHLPLGMLAETKRQSLPRLATTVKADHQALQHVLANAEWSGEDLRARRLDLVQHALGARPIILCLDATGDRTQGKTTDYAARQDSGNSGNSGNSGGVANGGVSVTASGVLGPTTFPLTCP